MRIMFALAAAIVLMAQPANPWRDEARALMSQLKFAEAIERLEIARKVRGIDEGEQKSILELLAYCQIAEGQRDAASATFISMLELDPSAELSREVASPKVSEVFDAAKKSHFPEGYVRLEERPSARGSVTVRLIDPWHEVIRVVLVQRRNGGEWESSVLDGKRRQFVFPLVVAMGGQLEWYVEARGVDDFVKWSLATKDEPRVEKVPLIDAQPKTVTEPPKPPPQVMPGRRIAGFILAGAAVVTAGIASGLQVAGFNLRQSARDRLRPPGDYAFTALQAEQDGMSQQSWALGMFIGAGLTLTLGLVLAW